MVSRERWERIWGLTPDCMLNLPSLEPSQCLSKLFKGDAQSARGNHKNPRMLQRIGQSQEAGAERPSGRWFAPPSTVRPTEEPTSKPSKNRWASKVPTSGIEGSMRLGSNLFLAQIPGMCTITESTWNHISAKSTNMYVYISTYVNI